MIDTATNTVVATVAVGNGPEGVAVTPDGTKVYVANASSANVSVIKTATNTVVEDGSGGERTRCGCGRRHPGWDKGLRRE